MRTVWQEIYGRIGVVGIIFAVLIIAGLVWWLLVGVPALKTTVCYPHCH